MFMRLDILKLAIPCFALLLISGCGSNSSSGPTKSSLPTFFERSGPIRVAEEKRCMAAGRVRETRFVRSRSSLGGPSVCGAVYPFEVSAADNGRVALRPKALLRCAMVPAVDNWVRSAVVPASVEHLGSPVVGLRVAASYSCRTRNSKPGAKLSEHGLANALDVAAFDLADGRRVTVKRGWRNNNDEAGFLRAVHRAACREFTTVLGPNSDRYHQDHFHLDLARHGRDGTYRVCR